jgi:hypothetical protein
MSEWSELAECLVELDLTIEDRESWATRPEDVAELEELERLRDDVQTALKLHYLPSRLRHRVGERHHFSVMKPTADDPRD